MSLMSGKTLIILSMIILMMCSISVMVSALPHSLLGYASYECGNLAVGASVDAENLNNSQHIYATVSSSGFYSFDCGSPGPDWMEGNEIKITIVQEDSDEYRGWSGIGYITIDKSVPHQQISNITLYSTYNNPPEKATKPTGLTVGYEDTLYEYSTSSIDPDDDQIYYWFTWGDGTTSGWIGPYDSGVYVSLSHSWSKSGSYGVRVKTKDALNATSGDWSPVLTVKISSSGDDDPPIQNNPPNTPSVLSGPSIGFVETSYSYLTSTEDSDNDEIFYLFDWGDGSNSSWIGPFSSGTICIASNMWSIAGIYSIKAKSRDANGDESSWSSVLSVEIKNETKGADSQIIPPTANFSYAPGLLTIESTIQFNDKSSDMDGNITRWLWDFGEGSTSSDQNSTHQYDAEGTYIVTLTVWGDSGGTNTTYQKITISKGDNKSDIIGDVEKGAPDLYLFPTMSVLGFVVILGFVVFFIIKRRQ